MPPVTAVANSLADPLADPIAGRLRATFEALNAAGVPYVVLRGFDPLDEMTTSLDIDMFIPAAALAAARPVLEGAGWRCRRTQVGRLPHLFFDCWDAPGGLVRSIDVVTALSFGADACVLRGDAAVVETSVLHEGVRVPSPWMTAFCFALHVLLDKGGLSDANAQRLVRMRARCMADPDGVISLRTSFGDEALALTRDTLDLLDLTDARQAMAFAALRARAEMLPVLTARPLLARWHAMQVRWRQFVRPVARIAILGIDGSGKSTLVSTATQHGATVRIHNGYLGNNSFRTPPAKWIIAALHTRRSRGETSGLPLRILASLDALWRPFELAARMAIAEHRAEIVLYDRFPLGQDDGKPTTRWGRVMLAYTRTARAILPQPDLVVLLDGDDHTIWSRKQEMPFDVHVKTQAGYRALLASLPWPTALVRTDGSLSETLDGLRNAMTSCSGIQAKLYGS
jgi:thymidylate kinase